MASGLVVFGFRFSVFVYSFSFAMWLRLFLVGCRAGGLRGRHVVVSAVVGQCFFAVFFVFGGLVVFHVAWAGCALCFFRRVWRLVLRFVFGVAFSFSLRI